MNEPFDEKCPRCGAPRAKESCPKCGVVYEKYDPQSTMANVPETVRQLWDNLEQHWEDPAAHALFVEQGLRHDAAGFVAGCYRQKGSDEMAVAQLEKLKGRLIETLTMQVSTEPPASNHSKRVVYLLLFFIIAILVFLIFAQMMK